MSRHQQIVDDRLCTSDARWPQSRAHRSPAQNARRIGLDPGRPEVHLGLRGRLIAARLRLVSVCALRGARMVVALEGRCGAGPSTAIPVYSACLIGTTFAPAAGASQKTAQSAINLLRFSNKSPRRYAASTLSPTACASAISITSLA